MNSEPSERAERNLRPKENRPLPSSKNPLFQNEAGCTTLLVKMSLICKRIKNDFYIKGWAPTLVLKQRPRGNSEIAYWGNLWIRENLVMTSAYHRTPTVHTDFEGRCKKKLSRVGKRFVLAQNQPFLCSSNVFARVKNPTDDKILRNKFLRLCFLLDHAFGHAPGAT